MMEGKESYHRLGGLYCHRNHLVNNQATHVELSRYQQVASVILHDLFLTHP